MIVTKQLVIASGITKSNPAKYPITVIGKMIKEIIFINTLSVANTLLGGFRIVTSGGKAVCPVPSMGFDDWLVGTNSLPQYLNVNFDISDTPYDLVIEAYNESAGSARMTITLEVSNTYREVPHLLNIEGR